MKKDDKKVLITGGCGFVGTNLIKYLFKKTNWEINILDNLSNNTSSNLKRIKDFSGNRVEFFKGDIRKRRDVKEAMEDCDLVVNLAAQVGVGPSQKNPKKDAHINIMGFLNLLEEAKERNIEKFIQASSAAPLGEKEPPLSEKEVPSPLSPYAASKLAGEGYCSAYSGSFGLNTDVLRFSNIYGPYSEHKQSAIHIFIKQILNNKPLTIHGDGTQTRDFIYVEDVCEAIYLDLIKDLPEKNNLLHVGTGEENSINDVVKILKKITDSKIEIENEPFPEGQLKRSCFDNSKIKKVLDWEPEYDLKKGLKETVEWFKNK